MYNEKICQRLRANSVVSAWENQRLLRCEKWPIKEKTCRRTKCWNKATNDSNQMRRARMWTWDSRGSQRPSGPTQLHSCYSRAWFWDRTLHFGDWNSEHTVLKKPIQPDEPKVPDDSWRSWRRYTQCERSCSSPQQRGRTRIFQVPLPNCLSDKKCKCIRDSVKCNSRCHKNCSCQNHDNALIK